MHTFQELLKLIRQNNPNADTTMLELAYEFASKAHAGQKRLDGSNYIQHSLETAYTLAKFNLDLDTIIAGVLHDIPEDTSVTLAEIEKNFGKEIAKLVSGITKLGKLKYRGLERYAENLRKMFVAMAEDVRVIFIKLADRLHNLETLSFLPPVKQQRIARETLEIYAPIANRLGMGLLKGQLEDAAFKYVYPEEYLWTLKTASDRYETQRTIVNKMIKEVRVLLKENQIELMHIGGRVKHLFSLYRKLLRKDMDINKVYDLVALRIVVKDVAACYQVLGLIHSQWKPMPGRIKDYIAQPKPNGYRSLHTTVFGKNGAIVEFQIRDMTMHETAEYGIAAHWHFKESNLKKNSLTLPPEQIKWIKELLEWQKNIKDNEQYFNLLKIDVFQNRIFVLTPKGDVIDLPENATPIDFAYHIHSNIGHKAAGAKVNDKIVPLDSILKSGDVVEIIVDKNRAGPSEDWLGFVKTNMAKSHIRNYFNKKRTGLLKFFNRK